MTHDDAHSGSGRGPLWLLLLGLALYGAALAVGWPQAATQEIAAGHGAHAEQQADVADEKPVLPPGGAWWTSCR